MKYWMLIVGTARGVLHAQRDADWTRPGGRPLCRKHGSFYGWGFGTPTCKRCLKLLDEIKAKQDEEEPDDA